MNATHELKSVWKGSINTLSMVAREIAERWGDEAVKIYDPQVNCFTFNRWQQMGYKVNRGEKAIRSVTFIGGSETIGDNGEKKMTGGSEILCATCMTDSLSEGRDA